MFKFTYPMHPVNQSILHRIHHHTPKKLPDTPLIAAVMVLLLIDESDQIKILLTKRIETLSSYGGHYSFPGGMHDPNDHDLWTTANREVQEELNISPDSYEYVGELDDFHDRFGNVVRPFVSVMEQKIFDLIHRISLDEVAKIYYLPFEKISEFVDDPTLHTITKRRPSYSLKINDVFVWGLTASILVHLRNVIFEEKKF